MPALFVGDNDRGEVAEEHIFNLLMCLAIISTAIMIPVILTFKDQPPTFPSYSQEKNSILQKHASLKKDIIEIVKN